MPWGTGSSGENRLFSKTKKNSKKAKHSFVDAYITHCPKLIRFNNSQQTMLPFLLKTFYCFLTVWSHVTTFAWLKNLDQPQYLWLNSTPIISCTLKCMKQRENLVSSSLDRNMLPLQFTPSPKYPDLQVHVKERLVLVQYASSWQLCCPVLHSSTNEQVEVLVLKLIWSELKLSMKKKTSFWFGHQSAFIVCNFVWG